MNNTTQNKTGIAFMSKPFPQGKREEIKFEDVVCVYTGRTGCACGCQGNYFYNSRHQEYGSKNRGYKVDDNEVNDNHIRKMMRKFIALKEEAWNIDDYIFTKEYETEYGSERVITIYLKEEK